MQSSATNSFTHSTPEYQRSRNQEAQSTPRLNFLNCVPHHSTITCHGFLLTTLLNFCMWMLSNPFLSSSGMAQPVTVNIDINQMGTNHRKHNLKHFDSSKGLLWLPSLVKSRPSSSTTFRRAYFCSSPTPAVVFLPCPLSPSPLHPPSIPYPH